MFKNGAVLFFISMTVVCMQPETCIQTIIPKKIKPLKKLAIEQCGAVLISLTQQEALQHICPILHLPELTLPLKQHLIKKYRSAILTDAFNTMKEHQSIRCDKVLNVTVHGKEVFIQNNFCVNHLIYDQNNKLWTLAQPLQKKRNEHLYSQDNHLISIHNHNKHMTCDDNSIESWATLDENALLYGITKTELFFKIDNQVAIIFRNNPVTITSLSKPLIALQQLVISKSGNWIIAKSAHGVFQLSRAHNCWQKLSFLPNSIQNLHKVTDKGLLFLSHYMRPMLWNLRTKCPIWKAPEYCHAADMNENGSVYALAHGFGNAKPVTLINLDAYTLKDLITILNKK